MPEDREPIARSAYDELAASYTTDVRTNPYNANLEFPATSALIPDVTDSRVLDAGCGTGFYTDWLTERGATVVGVDASEEMLARARERADDDTTFYRTDLGEDLTFAESDSFDGVVSALALGYVADWQQPFSEFARVLRPGGFLVFSTGHPLDQFPFGGSEAGKADTDEASGEANYFEVERREKNWDVEVPYYRRPFSAVVNPLVETGFRVDRVVEPQPTERFRERRPERYETESRQPVFLCVRAELP